MRLRRLRKINSAKCCNIFVKYLDFFLLKEEKLFIDNDVHLFRVLRARYSKMSSSATRCAIAYYITLYLAPMQILRLLLRSIKGRSV